MTTAQALAKLDADMAHLFTPSVPSRSQAFEASLANQLRHNGGRAR